MFLLKPQHIQQMTPQVTIRKKIEECKKSMIARTSIIQPDGVISIITIRTSDEIQNWILKDK